MMFPRLSRHNPRRGRRPLAFQAHPRDIWEQKKDKTPQLLLFPNIPAGGSPPLHLPHHLALGAQNPFSKDFDGSGARP
jgi:hypothetical protein